ncbi:hypothetical protein DFP72DRAFT_867069 [Ephemerocybe angulata]|uniref:DNA replication regulator SLD2 n=1 Tax=Ephemerocybe angulata TaxID=980116 RepID=A0A8H6IJ05_9AGAR|nr:hypothetical protein DFP72DRAFT_867069 [Tulosesus angulatus]
MSDVVSVRAEIKSWERAFKSKEGREPTVDDIRKLPHIAQKYKTYKKLSKATTTQPVYNEPTSSQSPATPSRPPRTRNNDNASLGALHSRVVTTAAPLAAFNPFSPQKAKGKEREKPVSRISQPVFNPFASPSKPRTSHKSTTAAPPAAPAPPKPPSPPAPSTAISRAKKRLRGEPVSPSPSKEKRQRIGSQTTLNFPKLNLGLNRKPFAGSGPGVNLDGSEEENEASFVDDSPVKPSGGRAFSLLFDEAQSGGDIFGLKKASTNLGRNLFGAQDTSQDLMKPRSNASCRPQVSQPSSSRGSTTKPTPATTPAGTPSEDDDETKVNSERDSTRRSRSPLLPPSPPPASSTTSRAPAKGKRKANPKAFANRKKMKLANLDGTDDEESTSDGDELKAKVKVVDRPQVKKANSDDDLDFELGLLDLPRSARTADFSGASEAEGAVEINLPEKFKEVLDLDTIHWKNGVEEDKVVKNLIYGRRTTCYDSKKGEIWDVGEDEVGDEDERPEHLDDDWEGEAVPWEVAEL